MLTSVQFQYNETAFFCIKCLFCKCAYRLSNVFMENEEKHIAIYANENYTMKTMVFACWPLYVYVCRLYVQKNVYLFSHV